MKTKGILTFAIGQDYAKYAVGLFYSAKAQGVQCSVVTDGGPADEVLLQHGVDKVLRAPRPVADEPAFWYEQFAYDLTPFDVTLKMDADCIIPKGADMQRVFDKIEQCQLLNGVPHTLEGKDAKTLQYRHAESAKGMPSVYSTMFGFSKVTEAHLFYQHIKMLWREWDNYAWIKDIPKTTDALYSVAWAASHTPSACLHMLPFHHMKPATMGWPDHQREDWTTSLPFHVDPEGRLYVRGMRVGLPTHYFDKGFMTDQLIQHLKDVYVRSLQSRNQPASESLTQRGLYA